MSISQTFIPGYLSETIGWTLLHSLWQGALISLLLAGILLILRKRSAQLRYNVTFISLSLLFVSTVATFFIIKENVSPAAYEPIADEVTIQPAVTELMNVDNLITSIASISFYEEVQLTVEHYLESNLGLMVSIWFIGLLLMSLRFLGNLVFTQRLKHYRIRSADKDTEIRIKDLAGDLGMNSNFMVKLSEYTKVPMVIGWLKPTLILPVNLFIQLPYDQVETIIVHELAHIRRNDFLHNMIQSFIEIILFYHPAVWWMSSLLRTEREHACDDVVINYTGNSMAYARALTSLQEMNMYHNTGLAPALFKSKNQLFKRITRMFGNHNITPSIKDSLTMAIVLIISITAISAGNAIPVVDPDLDYTDELYEPEKDSLLLSSNKGLQTIELDKEIEDDGIKVTLYSDSTDFFLFDNEYIHKSEFDNKLGLLYTSVSEFTKSPVKLLFADQNKDVFFDTIVISQIESPKVVKKEYDLMHWLRKGNVFFKYDPDSATITDGNKISIFQGDTEYPVNYVFYEMLSDSSVENLNDLYYRINKDGDTLLYHDPNSKYNFILHDQNVRVKTPLVFDKDPHYIFYDTSNSYIVGQPEEFFIFDSKNAEFMAPDVTQDFFDAYADASMNFEFPQLNNADKDFFIGGKFSKDLSEEEQQKLKKDIEAKYKKLKALKEDMNNSKMIYLKKKAKKDQEAMELEMLQSQKEVTYSYPERVKMDKKIASQKERLSKISREVEELKSGYKFDMKEYQSALKDHKLQLHRHVSYYWDLGELAEPDFFATPGSNMNAYGEFFEGYNDAMKNYDDMFFKAPQPSYPVKPMGEFPMGFLKPDSLKTVVEGSYFPIIGSYSSKIEKLKKEIAGFENIIKAISNQENADEELLRQKEILEKELKSLNGEIKALEEQQKNFQLEGVRLEEYYEHTKDLQKILELNELSAEASQRALEELQANEENEHLRVVELQKVMEEKHAQLAEIREIEAIAEAQVVAEKIALQREEEVRAIEEVIEQKQEAELQRIEELARVEEIKAQQYELIHEQILKEMISDKLIKEDESFIMELNEKRLFINGEKQSKKISRKYIDLYKKLNKKHADTEAQFPLTLEVSY